MIRAWLVASAPLLVVPSVLAAGAVGSGVASEPVPATPVFAFTDPEIVESSGLVARDGVVVTVNDSGDSNRVFVVDPGTGDTVGVTRWQGEAVDIEALAPAGTREVWVGDIGDNDGVRDRIVVSRVPVRAGEREVRAASYDLVYPDGPHDAETLLADPTTGRLLVVTKELVGRIYAAPVELDPDGPNELEPVGEALGFATDGSFAPDGGSIVVRNYGQAAVHEWPSLERVELVTLPAQRQGEGLAVSEARDVLLSSEGEGQEVLRVDLALPAPEVSAEPSPTPAPSASDPASEPDVDTDPSTVETTPDPDPWPWLVGGLVGAVALLVLLRSLRPR